MSPAGSSTANGQARDPQTRGLQTKGLKTGGLIIAAPTSGAGKTTIAIGLMAALRRAGCRVAPAKVGPDYIDPRFHDHATGRTSVNLDGWAMRDGTRDRLITALSDEADLIVVEGVMGLFDGAPTAVTDTGDSGSNDSGSNDSGSTGDLAARTGWPVILVVDAARQAQSVAALVHGFRTYSTDIDVAGVILNNVGSDRHAAILSEALAGINCPVFGSVPRQAAIARPSRHLGLKQAVEHPDMAAYLEDLADLVERHVDLEAVRSIARPADIPADGQASPALPPLAQRIAIAQDVAFGFSYPHVLDGWRAAGAELSFFSPLRDEAPDPHAGAVFLPGGYPELHAARLSEANRFRDGMRAAAGRGTWIYGECGGFMTLGEAIVDAEGTAHPMLDLLPLVTRFDRRKLHLGYRAIVTRAETPLGPAGTALRGHEFHYSVIGSEGKADRPFNAADARGADLGPLGLARDRVFGSYMHLIDLG